MGAPISLEVVIIPLDNLTLSCSFSFPKRQRLLKDNTNSSIALCPVDELQQPMVAFLQKGCGILGPVLQAVNDGAQVLLLLDHLHFFSLDAQRAWHYGVSPKIDDHFMEDITN